VISKSVLRSCSISGVTRKPIAWPRDSKSIKPIPHVSNNF
jgi:hypothetical protein